MKKLILIMGFVALTGCKKYTSVFPTTVNPGVGMLGTAHDTLRTGITIFSDNRDYHNTGIQLKYKPLSADSTIRITITGTCIIRAPMPESPADITIYRNETDLLTGPTRPYRVLSGASDKEFNSGDGAVETQVPVTITHDDCGHGTSELTYSLRIRTGDAPPLPNSPPRYEVRWGYTGGHYLYSQITIDEIAGGCDD